MKIEIDVDSKIYDKAYRDGYMDALKKVIEARNGIFNRRKHPCQIGFCHKCFEDDTYCNIGNAVRIAKNNYTQDKKPNPIMNGYIVSGSSHKCAICGKLTTRLEVFSEAYLCSGVCEEKFYGMVAKAESTEEDVFIDEVGGCHEGGLGWNPNGVFCGECSNSTCKGCVNENAEK